MATKNFEDPDKLIREILKELTNTKEEILNRVGLEGLSILSLIFKSEGRYAGIEWKPLNEKYLKYKIKKGYSEKKLHRTTTLSRSFTYEVEGNSVIIGTNVKSERGFPYPKALEYGTVKMPARPFMKPTKSILKDRMNKIAHQVFRDVFGD